jgi:hypothetical protein
MASAMIAGAFSSSIFWAKGFFLFGLPLVQMVGRASSQASFLDVICFVAREAKIDF